ncbi:recombinase family protein [Kitasatospora atroaurantiaca]|uniref:DNA invertase Pin-like site-specific DNA recombinase n=1 Tax=Kitasatospora atroaurantiaca TaxID=285545 RepID=A0A561EQM3_9ACTN|nr:DNA invertase Pin-like site-specific DNA recombinase [Kitasatospora atroaurantiaca]
MANRSTLLHSATGVVGRATAASVLRAVDYLRVSTEEQKRGYGIASQGKKTAAHIVRKCWSHTDTYRDEGVSGSLEAADRPDLKRLMEDAVRAPRPFDVVVVNEGRAIGRTGRAFWRWVWALEDMGIFVAIVDGDIDNTTSEGRREMRRQADYAETEYETIRNRTQGGLQEKAESEGSPHIGGRPPYGYYIQNKGQKGRSHLVVDEDEAKVIRRVYAMVVTGGLNLRQVAIRLNADGLRTRSGRPWSLANLRDRIMSRAVLAGELVFRGEHARTDADGRPVWGEAVAISLPRILTDEEATALCAKVAARANKSNRNQAFYPLTGRLVSLCNSPYTGASRESMRNGRRNYRCSGKTEQVPGQRVCDCSYVDAEAVENRVWTEVVALLGNAKRLGKLAAEWVGMTHGDQPAHAARIADLDGQIDDMNASIAAVIVASAKQRQSPNAIAAATKALNDELEQLEEMRAEATAWLAEIEDTHRRAQDLKRLAKMARHQLVDMTPEHQGEILALLDVRVFIEGPVPMRRGGVACTVQAWYRSAGLEAPASDLSDDDWELIAPLLPEGRRGRVRRSVEAIFAKARTGASWSELRKEYGSTSTASKYFNEWSVDCTWAAVNTALSEVERVALPVLDLAPPMRIEGRIDPRVMLTPEELSRTGW